MTVGEMGEEEHIVGAFIWEKETRQERADRLEGVDGKHTRRAKRIEMQLSFDFGLDAGAPSGPQEIAEGQRPAPGGERPRRAVGYEVMGPPTAEDFSSIEELERVARSCTACNLRAGCKGVVISRGNPSAKLMLVGEGPGAMEDEMGLPFVGPAGQLLDKVLRAMKISPEEDVYITNVVKCRPPNNRLPTHSEASACLPFLRAQIRLIAPEIIVCLGALAAQALLGPDARITRIRGRWFETGNARVMPTFHPAAVLRDVKKKLPLWEDFMKVRDEYRALRARRSEL